MNPGLLTEEARTPFVPGFAALKAVGDCGRGLADLSPGDAARGRPSPPATVPDRSVPVPSGTWTSREFWPMPYEQAGASGGVEWSANTHDVQIKP